MSVKPWKSRIIRDVAWGIGVIFPNAVLLFVGQVIPLFVGHLGDLLAVLMIGNAVIFLISIYKRMWFSLIVPVLLIAFLFYVSGLG
jgi:hypothetical protein